MLRWGVDAVAVAILVASGAFTVFCWLALWRGPDGLLAKLAWTAVSAIPLLGPLLYAGMHDAPSIQDEVDRAQALRNDQIDVSPPHHHDGS